MKLNRPAIAATCLLLAGCDEPPFEYSVVEEVTICDQAPESALEDFTLKCISGANPRSDEEPEDWIGICLELAQEIHCKVEPRRVTKVAVGGRKSWRDPIVSEAPYDKQAAIEQ